MLQLPYLRCDRNLQKSLDYIHLLWFVLICFLPVFAEKRCCWRSKVEMQSNSVRRGHVTMQSGCQPWARYRVWEVTKVLVRSISAACAELSAIKACLLQGPLSTLLWNDMLPNNLSQLAVVKALNSSVQVGEKQKTQYALSPDSFWLRLLGSLQSTCRLPVYAMAGVTNDNLKATESSKITESSTKCSSSHKCTKECPNIVPGSLQCDHCKTIWSTCGRALVPCNDLNHSHKQLTF